MTRRASARSRRPSRETVANRLHSAAIHLLRRVRHVDAATGLTAARLSALSVVVYAGPLTLGALARAEQVTAPTITRLVDGLERDGLVRREAEPRDARTTLVRATRRGMRLLARGRARRVEEIARLLEVSPPSELDLLDRAAAVLEDRLARDPGSPDPAVSTGAGVRRQLRERRAPRRRAGGVLQ